MAFAILKLSYNQPGDASLTGGICGTGFFVNPSTAITAHHILNDATFTPNDGFLRTLLWAISRDGRILRLERSYITSHPEIDTAVIRFPTPIPGVHVYDLAKQNLAPGIQVCGIGHIGEAMPMSDAQWQGPDLLIQSASLQSYILDTDGHVKRLLILDVNASDIKMQGVRGLELSFGSQVGMSGGPVIGRHDDKVLGLLSLGLPSDANVRSETFAVSIDEVVERIPLDV